MSNKIPSKERGCNGKIKLASGFAKRAESLAKKHGKQYGVYKCPHCDYGHLTTKIENRDQYADILVYITGDYSLKS